MRHESYLGGVPTRHHRGGLIAGPDGRRFKAILSGPPKPTPPPPIPEPVVMPIPDDEEQKKARRRSISEQQQRSGRLSTLLSDFSGNSGGGRLS